MMVMVVKGEEDQTIEEGLDRWKRGSEIYGILSVTVADGRIGPMIQQDLGDSYPPCRTGQRQSREALKVLDIDLASQGEETINSVTTSVLTGLHQRGSTPIVLVVDVGSVRNETIDDGDTSGHTRKHQGGRVRVVITGVDVASCRKKTINNIRFPTKAGVHQGRSSKDALCFFVGSKRQESVHNTDMSFLRGENQRCFSASSFLVVVDVGSCFEKTLHNGCVALSGCGLKGTMSSLKVMMRLGAVFEETVDDFQLSSFASRDEGSRALFFSFDVLSPGQCLLDLGRCGGREEIRHLEGWFQETTILI